MIALANRFEIICKPPDRYGRCRVTAKWAGVEIHHDEFPPYENWRRANFAQAIMQKLRDHLCGGSKVVTPEYLEVFPFDATGNGDDDSDLIWIGDQVVAAAKVLANEASEGNDELVTAKLRRLSDVRPEEVRWLWPGRIALAKLTLLPGDPGLGKSFITLDIAARESTGAPWPDSPHESRRPGGVVILSAEDGLEDTIRPRLDAAGANVERITALTGVEYRKAGENPQEIGVDLTRHLPALEQAIQATPDCTLVIVDPITAYMGATDSHKNAEVRAMLARLSELAIRRNVAILAVTHLNKASTQAAIYRAMGSLGFVAAARAVWAVVKDKDDTSGRRRLLLPIKNNLGNDETGLAYRLSARHAGGNVPVVEWEPEPVSNRVDDAMGAEPRRHGPKPEGRNEAVQFLRSALANGPRLGKEVFEEAREVHGISKRTLERAKRELKVECYQDPKPGPWYWKLPHPRAATASDDEQLGDLGDLAEIPPNMNGFASQESPGRQVAGPGDLAHVDEIEAVNAKLNGVADDDWGEQ